MKDSFYFFFYLSTFIFLLPMRRSLLFAFLLLLFSCTQKETIYEIKHENVVIDQNEPPPFEGVTTLQLQSYVNKLYIDLIGREPLPDELDDATDQLRNAEVAEDAMNDLALALQQSDEYYQRFYEIYSGRLLEGVTLSTIQEQLLVLDFFYQDALQNGDILTAQLLAAEIDKLQDLYDAQADYRSGLIDIREFMSRLVYNSLYDEINMGSENFVLSCFENFFKRYPTVAERQAGVTMVDGFPAQLLLADGNSKTDFIDILTNDPEFLQGLAIDIYQQLLARLPDSQEMGEAVLLLSEDADYQALQRQVTATAEYAGF